MSVAPTTEAPCSIHHSALPLESEFEYMLLELEMARISVRESMQRWEQLVTLYLTVQVAIGGGVLLLLTADTSAFDRVQMAGLLLIIFGVFGMVMWLRMYAAKVNITATFAMHAATRIYFHARAPRVIPYIESRPQSLLYDMRRSVLTKQVTVFLALLAVVHLGCVSGGAGALAASWVLVPAISPVATTATIAVLSFIALGMLAAAYAARQTKKADRIVCNIMNCATVEHIPDANEETKVLAVTAT